MPVHIRTRFRLGALLLLLVLVFSIHLPAAALRASPQTGEALIVKVLEAAMRRWMNEPEGGGKYWRNLDTRVTVGTTALEPPGAGAVTTQTLWAFSDYAPTRPVVSEIIYNWSSVERAQQSYNDLVVANSATPGTDFHGFPNSFFMSPNSGESGSLWPSRVWTSGNLVLIAREDAPVETLMQVLNVGPLEEFLYEEAVKNGLIPANGNQGQVAPPVAPPAPSSDTDQDGFPDARDLCKTQPAPQSADGCPAYSVVIRCGPDEPEEGMTIACTAEVSGSPDGDTVELDWDVDGKVQCQGPSCQWQGSGSSHRVSVTARSKPSGKSSSATTTILVRTALRRGADDPSSNIVITNLGCSSEITSDESMDCLVGFKRLDPKIQELVVIWEVNGATASTSTRTDDGDTYSLSQPAPGVHTVRVYVLDPNNAGRGRVMTTTARIFPGENAAIPPLAGAGAAAGTLLGIAGWLWAQWWFARQGGTPASQAISRLPRGPREDHSYSGAEAQNLLQQLGIYDKLGRLDGSDFRDPEFRARVEEILDTHFDQRKVKGIHYKVDQDGNIVEKSIEIVVEEPPDQPRPQPVKPPEPEEPKEEKPPEPVEPPDAPEPPEKKKPKTPVVDPREEKLRKKWKDAQRDFVDKQADARVVNAMRRLATKDAEKARAKVEAEISTMWKKGAYDATSHLLQTALELLLMGRIPTGAGVPINYVWNLIRQTGKDLIWGDERSVGDHVLKLTGTDPYVQDVNRLREGEWPNRLPAGPVKDILQVVSQLKKWKPIEHTTRVWGVVSRWTNWIAENSGQSKPLQKALQDHKVAIDWRNQRDLEYLQAKAERNSAKRHVQYAWDAYQEYLRKKRAVPAH